MSQAIDVEQMLQDSSVRIDRGRAEKVRERLFGRAKPVASPRYELRDELGRGRFGRVVLAFDHELRREVALKIVHYESPTEKARIEREAEALARISHANVVQVYDKGSVTEGTYFLALEYIEGQRLDRWLGASVRPLREVLRVFLQIAEGLSAAHRSDLVHRDFKPSNVVVTPDGRACVLDFGLAKRSATAKVPSGEAPAREASAVIARAWPPSGSTPSAAAASGHPSATLPDGRRPDSSPYASASFLDASLTEAESFVGTLLYASPEQLDQPDVDARSDQFSYCVALFEAAYGYRPFSAKSYLEQVATGRTDQRTSVRRVPRWLRRLLQRGLSPDPRDRFRDLEEIATILRRQLEPAIATRVAAAASLFTAVAVGGISLWQLRPDPPVLDAWDGTTVEQAHGAALRGQIEEYRRSWEAATERYYGGLWPDPHGPQARCLERARLELDHFVGDLESIPLAPERMLPALRPQDFLLMRFFPPEECLGQHPREPTDERIALLAMLAQSAQLQGEHARALVLLEQAERLGQPGVQEQERLALQRGILETSLGRPEAWDTLGELATHASSPGVRHQALAKQLEAGVALDRPLDDVRAVAATAMEVGRTLDVDATETKGWLAIARGHASVRLGEPNVALQHYDEALLLLGGHASAPSYPVAFAKLSRAFAETWISADPPAAAARALAALEELEAFLPESHPSLAAHRVEVGMALARAGDPRAARRLFLRVQATREECPEPCWPATQAEVELLVLDLNENPVSEATVAQLEQWERRADAVELRLRTADTTLHPLRKAQAARAWSAIMQARAKLGDYPRAIFALDQWMSHGKRHDRTEACGVLAMLDQAVGSQQEIVLTEPVREILRQRTTECGGGR